MEFQLLLLKILISTGLVLADSHATVMMGGHRDNKNATPVNAYEEYDYTEDTQDRLSSETIPPTAAPLVLPGYNLPDTIFNKGKPFYAEKDPLTGQIDLNHRSPSVQSDDSYEYLDEVPSSDIYDKNNIDRKDGSLSNHHSHKQTDVNQLTPNFHDFLNLPVKYNPNKYVYPLISSSYASTKIQGSVNKYHNHKDTFQKTSTTKPSNYYDFTSVPTARTTQRTMSTTIVTSTSTTPRPTTIRRYPELTTPPANILNSPMSHPSFSEEYEYDEEIPPKVSSTTERGQNVYLTTTQNVKNVYLTTHPSTTSTTRKVMSLFEQLFGDYDETVTTTESTKYPSTTQRSTTFRAPSSEQPSYPNIHAGPHVNVLTGSNMEHSYEYEEEDYGNQEDNIQVANEKVHKTEDVLKVEPLKPVNELNTVLSERVTPITTTTTIRPTTSSTSTVTTSRVTSLPLGENHINSPSLNRDPIIVATQNLREKLNSERVQDKSQIVVVDHQAHRPQLAPSSTNIHVAPGQDTVSFVMGHHQSVGSGLEGQFVGTAVKETVFQDNKHFRPLYSSETNQKVNKPPPPAPAKEVAGSAVTIQPLQNSEASLAIGRPINGVNKVPGQVMDAKLDNREQVRFPKPEGTKVVFPQDKKPVKPNLGPPRIESQQPNREVLKLNSKPMYHQLPSDLTPPKENDVVALPPRYGHADRPMRPPWDPRPGHFYSGKPEYVRPPRPAEIPYKRIDNLPNILPQFRPNMKHHHPMGPPPYGFDQRFNRQPLLERPSNRPIGFFEKMGPPLRPTVYKRFPPKNILRGPPPVRYDLMEERRPLAQQPPQSLDDTVMAEDRIINEDPRRTDVINTNAQELSLYQTPPNIRLANRRQGDREVEVETLQMIQAKNDKEKEDEEKKEGTVKVSAVDDANEHSDQTIYKVYPVNTSPIIDVGKKDESSDVGEDFNYQQQDRNDAPILKPHSRPVNIPARSDFPYPLERPDGHTKLNDLDSFNYNNQWNSVSENLDSRIINGGKINQISATLKTYTEKPIAIAYTPTEPHLYDDKYSMPNYGSPVIPEIRPGMVDNADTGYSSSSSSGGSSSSSNSKKSSEFTVHATMHTQKFNHKIDVDVETAPLPPQLDFQAPFQASVKLDSVTNQGWSVVRDKNKTTTVEETEVTTLPLATTSEFDIENFKPQLLGGFKPLYSLPEVDGRKSENEEIADREE
ncbi:hypothetical protein ABEB36_001358 [Hypothenemus hampei]|uniref:Uncharacterized protein n=1 Tax=Hypothenemus hampei TaxID=57062 RepID=A0ABD1FEB4_HYPHA